MLPGGSRRPEQAARFAREALSGWQLSGRGDVVEAARRMAAVAPGDPIDLRLEASSSAIRVEMICRVSVDRGREVLENADLSARRAGVIGIGPASCAWAELDPGAADDAKGGRPAGRPRIA